jgi:hypothetical protein
MKLLAGAYKLIHFIDRNKQRIEWGSFIGDRYQMIAQEMCNALADRFQSIGPGHFYSRPTEEYPNGHTFDNVLPIYLFNQAAFRQGEGIENVGQLPGVKLTDHQKSLLSKKEDGDSLSIENGKLSNRPGEGDDWLEDFEKAYEKYYS